MHEKNTAEVEKKIEQFVKEALAFNKKHNIFVRESTKEVYEKDVDDCLPVLQKINNSLGTKDIAKNVGFSSLSEIDNYEKMKSKVREELKRYFKPEFLNRIDETIVFHELTLDEVKEIVDLMLDRVHEQLKNSDLEVVLLMKQKSIWQLKATIKNLVPDRLEDLFSVF
jgi:Glu-tRNA(Gln) amidotransferase subunit E-like FAD-binding protein